MVFYSIRMIPDASRIRSCSLAFLILSLLSSCLFLEADELFDAIQKNDMAKLKSLIEANPSLLAREIEFRSYPLIEAAALANTEMVEIMLEKGARPDVRNSKTLDTALLAMCKEVKSVSDKKLENLTALLDVLAKYKADFKAVDFAGSSAVFIVASYRQSKEDSVKNVLALIKSMIGHGAKLPAIENDKVLLNWLLSLGPVSAEKEEPQYAALEMAKGLIGLGIDVNAADKDRTTALIVILANKKIPDEKKTGIVRLLMEKGAREDVKNKDGDKPVHMVDRKSELYEIMRKTKPIRDPR